MKETLRNRNSFTLIELLVVIAVIALLASMLLPALQQAREKARQIVCVSQLKQVGLAIMMYADDYDNYPPFLDSPTNIWRYTGAMQNYFGPRFYHSADYPDCFKIYFCPTTKAWYGVNRRIINKVANTLRKLSLWKYPSKSTLVFCTGSWESNDLSDIEFHHQNNSVANVLFLDGHVESINSTVGMLDFMYPYGEEGGAKYW